VETHSAPKSLLTTIVVTGILLGLIAVALEGESPAVAAWAVISAATLSVAFHFMLPGSGFLALVFSNCIGIYACFYVLLSGVNFGLAPSVFVQVSFVLPLAGFAIGVVIRRESIRHVISSRHLRIDTELTRAVAWILPLGVIAVGSFLLPHEQLSATEQGWLLLFAMSLIAALALTASRDIAIFLIDTGILFEDFTENAKRLIKPAFAFFTWYGVLVIIFACLYTIIDRYAHDPQFVVSGVTRDITFSEALYVSVVTLSTVGFGDIVPHTPAVRMLVASEIFIGVLLILFGVQALMAATTKRPN